MNKPEIRSDMLLNWSAEDIANHILPWIIDSINNGNFAEMKEMQGSVDQKWEMVLETGGGTYDDKQPLIPEYCYDQCELGNPACPTECQEAIQQVQDLVQKIKDVSIIIKTELAEQGLELPGEKWNSQKNV